MRQQKMRGLKEFRRLEKLEQKKITQRDIYLTMRESLRKVEELTAKNRQRPNSLKNFKRLVKEGNIAKLIAYFSQYEISSNIIQNNLEALIEEELRDLAR